MHDFAAEGVELGAGEHFEGSGAGELDGDAGLDAAGAGGHDIEGVGEEDGFVDVMGDEEHGFTAGFPDAEQELLHREAGLGVERAEGFVHQEDAGFHHQGAGDADALFHAARKLIGEGGFEVLQADAGEGLAGDGVAFGAREAFEAGGEGDVLEHGEPGEEGGFLEHHGAVGTGFGDGVAEDADGSGGDLLEPGEDVEQGGFAAAGGAEKDGELAVGDGEVDVGQGLDGGAAGVGFLDGAHFYCWGGRCHAWMRFQRRTRPSTRSRRRSERKPSTPIDTMSAMTTSMRPT